MNRQEPCLPQSKEAEVTAPPNKTTPIMSAFGQVISKSVPEGLLQLCNLPEGVNEVSVDNFISFTPTINVSVPPKSHKSKHSQPEAKEGAPIQKHIALLESLAGLMKSLLYELMGKSSSVNMNQADLADRLMCNLLETHRHLEDQRRLMQQYFDICNAAEDCPPTTSLLGKARTALEESETEDPYETVSISKYEKEVKCSSLTSPQVFPKRVSDKASELIDIDPTLFAQQIATMSTSNTKVSDANRVSEEFEGKYDSSSNDQQEEESSSGSLFSDSWDGISEEDSYTSSFNLRLQRSDLRENGPAFVKNNTFSYTKHSEVKNNSTINLDKSSQKHTDGSVRLLDLLAELKNKLSARTNAKNSDSGLYVSKMMEILEGLRRNHANKASSASIYPSNRSKSSDILEIARIFALLSKFYGLIPKTRNLDDVAREISKILSAEKCEDNDMPPKPAKGIINIAVHVGDLPNLMLSLGNRSNSAQISNVKSGSSKRNSTTLSLQDQVNQFRNSSPARSNEINSANDSGEFPMSKKKTVVTMNDHDSRMKCVEIENRVNNAGLSQPMEAGYAGVASGGIEKVVDLSNLQVSKTSIIKKENVISAALELFKGNLLSDPSQSSSTSENTQKSENASFVSDLREFLHTQRNEADSGNALYVSRDDGYACINAEFYDDDYYYVFKPNPGTGENVPDTMKTQELEITSHEYRDTQDGVSNSSDDGGDSSVNSEPEPISPYSMDNLNTAGLICTSDSRPNPTSVSDAPDSNGNLNSSVEVYDATAVTVKENGSGYLTSKFNSRRDENNAVKPQDHESIRVHNQEHEANAPSALADEGVIPCGTHELECCTANSKDFISPPNIEGGEYYANTSKNHEPIDFSRAPEKGSGFFCEGPKKDHFQAAANSNEFAEYVSSLRNETNRYSAAHPSTMEPAMVGIIGSNNFNGYHRIGNVANYGTASLTASNTQKRELGTGNVTYPGPYHFPVNWVAPAYASFATTHGRCLPYGGAWQAYDASYWNENNYINNANYWKPGFPSNNNNLMTSPVQLRRKHASYDLPPEEHSHMHFRTNSEPNGFSGIDYPQSYARQEDFTATMNPQEHTPAQVNAGSSHSFSLSQTYATNPPPSNISVQEYGSEVNHANQASGVNSTTFSPASVTSKNQRASGEVKLPNILNRVSQSSAEPLKENRSSRAATSFSASLNQENCPPELSP